MVVMLGPVVKVLVVLTAEVLRAAEVLVAAGRSSVDEVIVLDVVIAIVETLVMIGTFVLGAAEVLRALEVLVTEPRPSVNEVVVVVVLVVVMAVVAPCNVVGAFVLVIVLFVTFPHPSTKYLLITECTACLESFPSF